VQCGNIGRVRDELQRLTDLNKYIEDVGGQDPSIFDFMVQETLDLFNEIIVTMSEGNDPMTHLVTTFNDPQISQCLVYHLRLLACARLKGHSSEYESWLVGSVQDYLDGTVMPVNQEIDHICVALVRDILLAPANIVLEIAYLDRSQGDEVNVHRFHEGATGQGSSASALTIYLLYRPGHYDILYRETPVSSSPPVDLQIHRVSYSAQVFEEPIAAMQNTAFVDMSAISMIPGLASSSLPSYGPPSTAPPPMTGTYATSPGPHWDSQPLPPEVISAPPPSQPSPPQQQLEATVRFSKWNFPTLTEGAAENNSTYEPAFTTNTFKNSHYNTAHYNNLNFQPEMYQPDADEEIPSGGNSRAGGRKRSTEHCPGIKKEK
jgi:ubiquitin thioesterase protein OTUB1